MALPVRKHPRLKNFDYSQCGCYHLTICTKNRSPFLGQVVSAENDACRSRVLLTDIGHIALQYVENISVVYRGVSVDKYVIMPNHVHLLITLSENASTSIPEVVRSLKRMVTKAAGKPIWQDSYYDVIIRNDSMYRCEWTYIDNNPDKWYEDELYVP